MRRLIVLLAAPLLLALGATMAQAFSVTIENASFEETKEPLNNGGASGEFVHWKKVSGSPTMINPPASFFNEDVPDGNNVAQIFNGGISQTLTEQLQPNTNYTLSVEVGWRKDFGSSPDYIIRLLAGNTELTKKMTSDTPGLIQGNFLPVVLTYSTGANVISGDLKIELIVPSTTMTIFDDVQLEASNLTPDPGPDPAPVPLPGAVVLLGLGLFSMALVRFRG